MSNNADFDDLLAELRELRDAQPTGTEPELLVLRRVHGMTPEKWRAFRQRYPNSRWGALPLNNSAVTRALSGLMDKSSSDLCPDACPPQLATDHMLARMLCSDLFRAQIERDLQRQQRSGGQLSFICMDLTDAARASAHCARIMVRLAGLAAQNMEACDTLGALPDRGIALMLPGFGALRARSLAVRLREALLHACPAEDACGFAVLSLAQPARITIKELLERIAPLLDRARARTDGVEFEAVNTTGQPDTLVQSQEKRFLFFGGA